MSSGVDDIAGAIDEAPGFEPPEVDARVLADLTRNDHGNAERLIKRFGRDLAVVDEAGWYVWDGRRWDRSLGPKGAPGAEVVKRAHLTGRAIADEAAALQVELEQGVVDGWNKDAIAARTKRIEDHRKFGTGSGNISRVRAMLESAEPYLRRRPAEMDARPLLFNVLNGTLELGTEGNAADVRLRPHNRLDLMTHLAPVKYDPEAQCPNFDAFIADVLPAEDLRVFAQSWFGYCLTGLTSEQVLLLCYGLGSNGKSTLLETISAMAGDYSASVPIETFLANDRRGGGDATPDLARLPGARMVGAAEPERGARLAEGVVKMATGGEKIIARHLFQGQFEYEPSFKLILSANVKPAIRGQDEGIWRRVLLLPFEAYFPREKRDKALKAKLLAELPGILNWALDGFRMWRERGLVLPRAVVAATEEYRRESDPIGEFLRTATVPDKGHRVQAARLYGLYCQWAKANAVEPASGTAFGRRLGDLGIRKEKYGVVFYADLRIIVEGFGRSEGSSSDEAGEGSNSGSDGDPGAQGEGDYGGSGP